MKQHNLCILPEDHVEKGNSASLQNSTRPLSRQIMACRALLGEGVSSAAIRRSLFRGAANTAAEGVLIKKAIRLSTNTKMQVQTPYQTERDQKTAFPLTRFFI